MKYKMRSTIIILLTLLLGCAGCVGVVKHVKQYPDVTAEKLRAICTTPEEVYNVPQLRFPIPAQVIRHENCMGIDDLLTVAWPGDLSEKNVVAARLLVLMYLEHNNNSSFSKITGKLLKIDKMLTPRGQTVGMAFYELSKIAKKPENENE